MPVNSSVVIVVNSQSRRMPTQVVKELWIFRELLWVLTGRIISIRYAQTSLGIAWVVVQPVLLTAIFTFIFGYLARIPTTDVPYPVLVFSGLLLWQYFSRCVSEGSGSLQSNASIISKVYFPRILILIAPALAAAVDLFFGLIVLLCMLAWYGLFPFGFALLILPLIIIGTGILGFSISLVLAPLSVRRRDILIALPFLLQLGMYVSPVVYELSFVPDQFRWLFYLNPITAMVEGMRWILLGSSPPPAAAWIATSIIILFFLLIGYKLFERTQANLVDEL